MNSDILKALVFTPMARGRWGLPAVFVGQPGCGKTAIVRGFTEEWGMQCEVLSPGARGDGAFGVVPVPLDGVLAYPRPDWTDKFESAKGKRGLLFCDEMNTGGQQIEAAMLMMIADRVIGCYAMPRGVRVIGAMNPPDIAANGHDLMPPTANRVGHFESGVPSVTQHAAYMLSAVDEEPEAKSAEAEERRVKAEWPEAWARAVGLETAFLGAQGHWKNKLPDAGNPKASKAWPSDRTWEYATRALASAEVHGLAETDRDTMVAAFIGVEAHEAFSVFVEHADIPKAADVLDGKVKFKWEPRRLDRSAAVVAACTALVVPKEAERRQERAAKLWELLTEASAYDITVPAMSALAKASLHLSREALQALNKAHPALRAAGIKGGEEL